MADYGTYFKEKTFYECRSCGIGQLFTRKESYVHFKEHHGKIFDNAKEACYMCCKSFTIGDLKRHYPKCPESGSVYGESGIAREVVSWMTRREVPRLTFEAGDYNVYAVLHPDESERWPSGQQIVYYGITNKVHKRVGEHVLRTELTFEDELGTKRFNYCVLVTGLQKADAERMERNLILCHLPGTLANDVLPFPGQPFTVKDRHQVAPYIAAALTGLIEMKQEGPRRQSRPQTKEYAVADVRYENAFNLIASMSETPINFVQLSAWKQNLDAKTPRKRHAVGFTRIVADLDLLSLKARSRPTLCTASLTVRPEKPSCIDVHEHRASELVESPGTAESRLIPLQQQAPREEFFGWRRFTALQIALVAFAVAFTVVIAVAVVVLL